MAVSTKELEKVLTAAERAKARVAKMQAKAAETMGIALGAMEVSGTAFGFGYARGRFADEQGAFEIMGIPPDLLAGVALHGLGFLGGFGRYSEHAHHMANGALASYLTTQGVKFGVEGRSAPLSRPVVGAGARGSLGAGRVRMSDADLANVIANASR